MAHEAETRRGLAVLDGAVGAEADWPRSGEAEGGVLEARVVGCVVAHGGFGVGTCVEVCVRVEGD